MPDARLTVPGFVARKAGGKKLTMSRTFRERLMALTKTTNGFEIAETDLQLRGPGEFFGTRQHGLPEFKLADVTAEIDLLQQAREDALAILAADNRLTRPEHRPLRAARAASSSRVRTSRADS